MAQHSEIDCEIAGGAGTLFGSGSLRSQMRIDELAGHTELNFAIEGRAPGESGSHVVAVECPHRLTIGAGPLKTAVRHVFETETKSPEVLGREYRRQIRIIQI